MVTREVMRKITSFQVSNEKRESDDYNSGDDHAIVSFKLTTQVELDLLLGRSEDEQTQVLMSNSNVLMNESLTNRKITTQED